MKRLLTILASPALLLAVFLLPNLAYAGTPSGISVTPTSGSAISSMTVTVPGSGTSCVGWITDEPTLLTARGLTSAQKVENVYGTGGFLGASQTMPFTSSNIDLASRYSHYSVALPTSGTYHYYFFVNNSTCLARSSATFQTTYTVTFGGGGGGGGISFGFGTSTAMSLAISTAGSIGAYLYSILPLIVGIVIALLGIALGFNWAVLYISGRNKW